MRNSRRYKERKQQFATPVTDRTLWYSELSSLDPKKKNEVWAAQALFFMKRNYLSFLDSKKAGILRDADQLKIDPAKFKQMFDPVTAGGNGGKAEYVSSDWSANPIYLHLKNIIKADIENTGKDIEVNLTDKYAKTRRMNDNYKIIYQKHFRKLINYLAEEIGVPGVSDFQDPYKWVDNLLKTEDDETSSPDTVNKYMDLIKNQITDDQDLALYNELLYKGDYEMAFELGMKYYIFHLNKWNERFADEFLNDIMHFNKACGEWYTDLITGRPVIERFAPEALKTSPFRKKDGEDIQYYFIEYTITFGEFMRTVGKNLSSDKLKEVFQLMKQRGTHNIEWRDEFFTDGSLSFTRDNALVNVGRAAFLSTDMEVQMEDVYSGIRSLVDITWEPTETQKRIEKRYNVWRWWYYIPPVVGDINNSSWAWQSNFIFQLQKFQDQQRYGDNGRYAKSPLVIYDNSSQATFSDIVQAYMPKITHLWHRYQNYLVNDIDASILSEDFIGGLLSAVDEDNKISYGDKNKATGGNGRDSYMEQWKMIKQQGTGFLKMTDKNGNPIIDPGKLVVTFKNGFIDKAEKALMQMMMLYDLMIKSLAFSPMTAGEEVKPRTPVAALEQTLKATNRSRFFIQKSYEEIIKQYGERIVRYIVDIAREVDKYQFPNRWSEFMDNIGYPNGLAIEGLKDIDPESIGLTVSYVDNQTKKDFVMQLAIEHSKRNEIDDDFIYLLMGIDNWKYAFVLMRMAIRKRKAEMQEQAALDHQRALELGDQQLQISLNLQKAKDDGHDQNIITQGKIDEMVNSSLNREKYLAQSQLKKETDELRRNEHRQDADLKKEEESHKSNLEMQKPI